MVVLLTCAGGKYFYALAPPYIGSLFTTSQKTWLLTNDTFATHTSPVCDVTDTGLLAQNGNTQGRGFFGFFFVCVVFFLTQNQKWSLKKTTMHCVFFFADMKNVSVYCNCQLFLRFLFTVCSLNIA